jgi:hypothetical protein
MPGYAFRSRRMIRAMGHMLFPRYIQREARDFFYLTQRSVLPGPSLPGATPWRTSGLPQHGFPYAVAIASASATTGPALHLLEADPRALRPGDGAPVVLALSGPSRGSRALYYSRASFVVASRPPPDSTLVVRGYDPSEAPAATARAELCVLDDDGMLAWVELPPGMRPDASSAAAMDAFLARAPCPDRMVVTGDAHALLGGTVDVAGDVASPPASGSGGENVVALVRARAPDAHLVFTDTPLVPVSVWQPLQAKRVRYFYKPAASASVSPSAP